MIEEIKKRLGAGEVVELECVDRGGFLKDTGRSEANENILDQGSLVVDYIDYEGDIRLVGGIVGIYLNVILSEEFKYFRIKESSATFDDLIDTAVKAVKDGVLDGRSINLSDHLIGVNIDGRDYSWNKEEVYYGKLFFNTLYTETFVIESQSDLSMIKLNDKKTKVKLTNGELVNDEFWDNIKNMTGKTQFLLLKGATVTQKRGGL